MCATAQLSHTVTHYNDSFFSGIFKHFQKKKTILNEKPREEMPERQQKASWRFLNFSRRAIFPSNSPSVLPLSIHPPATQEGVVEWVKVKAQKYDEQKYCDLCFTDFYRKLRSTVIA